MPTLRTIGSPNIAIQRTSRLPDFEGISQRFMEFARLISEAFKRFITTTPPPPKTENQVMKGAMSVIDKNKVFIILGKKEYNLSLGVLQHAIRNNPGPQNPVEKDPSLTKLYSVLAEELKSLLNDTTPFTLEKDKSVTLRFKDGSLVNIALDQYAYEKLSELKNPTDDQIADIVVPAILIDRLNNLEKMHFKFPASSETTEVNPNTTAKTEFIFETKTCNSHEISSDNSALLQEKLKKKRTKNSLKNVIIPALWADFLHIKKDAQKEHRLVVRINPRAFYQKKGTQKDPRFEWMEHNKMPLEPYLRHKRISAIEFKYSKDGLQYRTSPAENFKDYPLKNSQELINHLVNRNNDLIFREVVIPLICYLIENEKNMISFKDFRKQLETKNAELTEKEAERLAIRTNRIVVLPKPLTAWEYHRAQQAQYLQTPERRVIKEAREDRRKNARTAWKRQAESWGIKFGTLEDQRRDEAKKLSRNQAPKITESAQNFDTEQNPEGDFSNDDSSLESLTPSIGSISPNTRPDSPQEGTTTEFVLQTVEEVKKAQKSRNEYPLY